MLNQFYIIKPEPTINLIANPSPKYGSHGYEVDGGSYDVTYTFQRRSSASFVVEPSASVNDGIYYAGGGTLLSTFGLVSGTTYTFSVDVYGVLGIPYRIYFANTSGTLLGTATTFTGTGWWQRVEVTYTAASTADHRVYVTKNNSANTGDFYVDGLQVEAKAYATTYCDGSVDGCTWAGLPYQSISKRDASVRTGGKKIYIDSDYEAYLISQSGTGMPTMTTLITNYGGSDGGYFEGQIVGPRTLSLAYSIAGDGQAAWHAKRAQIIDLLKRNNTAIRNRWPCILGYTGAGGDEVEIGVVFEDGMTINEGRLDIESAPLRFLAPDPFWYDTARRGALLTHSNPLVTAGSNIMKRDVNGVWSEIVANNTIECSVVSPDGKYLYIGGQFTVVDAVSAIGVARYEIATGTWSHLGAASNTLNGDVYDMAFGPDGRLWIVGDFDNVQGIATADNIVVYRPATNDYASVTTAGASASIIYAVAIDSSYRVYVGGDFTSIGGSSADFLAYYTVSNGLWSHVGSGPTAVTDGVRDIAIRPNRDVVIAGLFNSVDGVANTYRIARWSFATSTWKSIASGLTIVFGGPRPIVSDSDGTIYMGINQATLNGVTINNIARWNGSTWQPLMNGIGDSADIWSIVPLGNGRLLVGGADFSDTVLGFARRDNLVEWTGTAWVPTDIDLGGVADIRTMARSPDGTLFVVQLSTINLVNQPGQTTITTNEHNADCYPIITVRAASTNTVNGRLSHIKNETTKDSVYLNLEVMPGEVIVMDFRPNHKTFRSTYRGSVLDQVIRGSNYGDFHLAPGDNLISTFLSGAGGYLVDVEWVERFWSNDNTAHE